MTFFDELKKHPIIAAARSMENVERASRAPVAAVFILGGSISTLSDMVKKTHDGGKRAFLHIDLAEGLGRDDAAIEWCVKTLGVDGVISTNARLIRAASDLGALTVQRLFIMDSTSFDRGVKLLQKTAPDMAEVLPGIAPKAVKKLREALDMPVIAGGMITERDEIISALDAGALAVSVSDETLWTL